jgi:hypothetical protein
MVKPASSEVTKPSVPEFTLRYVDNSFDVPPSTSASTNPYTGETSNITTAGHYVENRTIELTIKNQPFTSYESNGQIINFYYNVRIKGYYAQNWTTVYNPDSDFIIQDSNYSYTKISDFPYSFGEDLLQGGQVDFQVEALIGSVNRDASQSLAPWVFDGQTSGWSNTQTVTIPASAPTATPNTSTFDAGSSVLLGLDWVGIAIVALLGVVAVLLVFLFVFQRKRNMKMNP